MNIQRFKKLASVISAIIFLGCSLSSCGGGYYDDAYVDSNYEDYESNYEPDYNDYEPDYNDYEPDYDSNYDYYEPEPDYYEPDYGY